MAANPGSATVDVDGEIFRAGFLDDQSSKAASGGLIEDYRSVVNGHGHVLELQGMVQEALQCRRPVNLNNIAIGL